ncbi:hypothetical protein SMICM17S_01556 [Streptomyces microflavus]
MANGKTGATMTSPPGQGLKACTPAHPKERSDVHRNPRGLRRDARPGKGGQVRLPGHQCHLDADPARGPARLRGGRERRHRPDLHGRCGVPGRPVQQGHGDGRGRPGRVRAHRRGQVRHHRRAAHGPLPQGQAGRLRTSAARRLRRARRQGSEPAVPVPHVGWLGRDPRRQPGHRPGAAGQAAAAKIILEVEITPTGGEEDGVTHEINDELYTTVDDALRTAEALGLAERAATCWPPPSATSTASTSRATSCSAPSC